jgi:hypothetical protein
MLPNTALNGVTARRHIACVSVTPSRRGPALVPTYNYDQAESRCPRLQLSRSRFTTPPHLRRSYLGAGVPRLRIRAASAPIFSVRCAVENGKIEFPAERLAVDRTR